MNNYIIINADTIQRKINFLENKGSNTKKEEDLDFRELNVLRKIISNPTPLTPELEKAFEAGRSYQETKYDFEGDDPNPEVTKRVKEIIKDKYDYINNLRFEI